MCLVFSYGLLLSLLIAHVDADKNSTSTRQDALRRALWKIKSHEKCLGFKVRLSSRISIFSRIYSGVCFLTLTNEQSFKANLSSDLAIFRVLESPIDN